MAAPEVMTGVEEDEEFKEVIEVDGNMFLSAGAAARPERVDEKRHKRTIRGDTNSDSGVPSESKTEREIRELRIDVKNIMTKMDRFFELMDKVETLSTRVVKHEERLKAMEDTVKGGVDEVKELTENYTTLLKRVEKVEERTSIQEDKSVDQEARSRRNNLIVQGLKETAGENEAKCMKMAHEFVKEQCKVTEPVVIERAHRIGNEHAKKPRPFIMRFLDYNDRQTVKRARINLPRDSGLSISDDLPRAVRQARQRLNEEVARHKAANNDVWVTYPAKLFVGGKFIREEPVITEPPKQRNTDNRHMSDGRNDGRNRRPEHPWRQASGGGPHQLDGNRREREREQRSGGDVRRGHDSRDYNGRNAYYSGNRYHGGNSSYRGGHRDYRRDDRPDDRLDDSRDDRHDDRRRDDNTWHYVDRQGRNRK